MTPVARVQRWKRRAREVNEALSIGPGHVVEKKRRSEGKGEKGFKGVLEHGVISEIDPSQGKDKKRKFEGKGDHEDLEREDINKKVRTGEVLLAPEGTDGWTQLECLCSQAHNDDPASCVSPCDMLALPFPGREQCCGWTTRLKDLRCCHDYFLDGWILPTNVDYGFLFAEAKDLGSTSLPMVSPC
ncbi:hypothetical protein U1Q18_001300 [Sarracenia purpurea var. burkii]